LEKFDNGYGHALCQDFRSCLSAFCQIPFSFPTAAVIAQHMRGAGFFIAVVTKVMVNDYTSMKSKLGPFLSAPNGLAVFSALVIVDALGLAMPFIPTRFKI
jgi:hypothetical protein